MEPFCFGACPPMGLDSSGGILSPPQSAIARGPHGGDGALTPVASSAACSLVKPGVGGPTSNLGPRPLNLESGWSELLRAV
jgi:hypothetical protein